MRLVCPNCGAQYEVDDRVIPDAGRDVQCSNCGHAWFQGPPDQDADLAEELGLDAPRAPEAEPDAGNGGLAAEPEAAAAPEPADQPEQPEPEDEPPSGDDGEIPQGHAAGTEEEQPPAPEPVQPPSSLDDGVREILQEEAQREMDARAEERAHIETQPDLGLEEGETDDSRRKTVRERMARLRGLDEDDTEAAIAAAVASGNRRDLLPDIEEINSTLDAAEEDPGNLPADADLGRKHRRGGFRRGFIMMLVFAVIVVLLYVNAPWIARTQPAAEPYLAAYVDVIDRLRAGLDAAMQWAIARMQGVIDGNAPPG